MGVAEILVARMRGGFAGATSGAVSIAAHGLGGGGTPSQSTVALLIATTLALGVSAAGTRLPVGVILGTGQVLGHVVLTFDDGHTHVPGPAMILAHGVATVVAALLVVAAERGCRRALTALCRIASTPPPRLVVPTVVPIPPRIPVLRSIFRAAGIAPRAPPVTV